MITTRTQDSVCDLRALVAWSLDFGLVLVCLFVCLLLRQGPMILARLEIDIETTLTLDSACPCLLNAGISWSQVEPIITF